MLFDCIMVVVCAFFCVSYYDPREGELECEEKDDYYFFFLLMFLCSCQKRKVEYKDPQESAWEAFQKTISKETEVNWVIPTNTLCS